MREYYKKPIRLIWPDFSGGANKSDKPWKIKKNQVQDSLNAILRKNGIQRRPGTDALDSFDLTAAIQGLHIFRELGGTENLLMVCGGKLYSLDKTSGAYTERFNLTGSGQAYFTDTLDKCWITNGTKAVKCENNLTTYQMGITAPSGASAAKLAGGSLPDGTYAVYISYARKISGTNCLFSVAESLGNVALSGSDNSIRISSFGNSSDAQVTNKVVWLTEPSGTVTYFYHETDDNTTETVDVTDATGKNENVTYSVYGVNNNFPGDGTIPMFDYIHSFDGRIWGTSSNIFYYSLKNRANVYDMERFFPNNKTECDFAIEGIFSLGDYIFFNTKSGLIKQHRDVTRPTEMIHGWYFYHINTVRKYRDGVIGLTNDGVKIFNGEKWYDYDISYAVRDEIEKIYSSTAGFSPFAEIYRRNIRTEYHLCYNDSSLTSVTNNMRLVLNLNKLEFLPEKEVVAPWEFWGNGATHLCTDAGGTMYHAQSHASAPKLYKENTNNTYDNGIYLRDGTLGGATTEIYLLVKTRIQMPDIRAFCVWDSINMVIKQAETTTVTVVIPDIYNREMASTFGTGKGGSFWAEDQDDENGMIWDVDAWDPNITSPQKKKLPMLEGRMVYIKIEQTANDPDFEAGDMVLDGVIEKNRFT